jgi:hypothetical protein
MVAVAVALVVAPEEQAGQVAEQGGQAEPGVEQVEAPVAVLVEEQALAVDLLAVEQVQEEPVGALVALVEGVLVEQAQAGLAAVQEVLVEQAGAQAQVEGVPVEVALVEPVLALVDLLVAPEARLVQPVALGLGEVLLAQPVEAGQAKNQVVLFGVRPHHIVPLTRHAR